DAGAEHAVIGSLLIDGQALTRVAPFLKPEDFYLPRTRWCFEASLALFNRGEAINQVTVAHELLLQNRLEEIGGAAFLGQMVLGVPTSVHIEHYGRIVHRMAVMRQLIQVAGDIAAIGYEGGADADAAMSQAENLLFKVRSGRATRDFVHIRQVLDQYMEQTAGGHLSFETKLAPVPTGYTSLDKLLTHGMQRSDLLILAARPSLGKSSLAFNIARNVAGRGSRVGIFSLEMSAEQIAVRMLSGEARVPGNRVRTGPISDVEERRLMDGIGVLSDLPIYIDDTSFQTVVEIRSKARRLQAEAGVDLLIVDYLQLIGGSSGRPENRVQEMSEISRSLKGLARDLDIPVLACSQLSRAVEHRESGRPKLSDLRESGSIEQDADVVAFIHREDKVFTREEWEKRFPQADYPENIAELIIAKHRNGPTGMVSLLFRSDLVRFESLEHRSPSREFA
ncbi:MAG: replicative DNA helicase, partial [SAR202 cluster bacterium]|nr:replicative DNA helicase [SAR202 cluster bacterium]